MKSSKMTRGFGALTMLGLASGAVLVFHSAALAQQADRGTQKGSQKAESDAKATPDAPADAAGKAAAPPQDLPPEYGPPPGYRHVPPPPPPGYGPNHDYNYGPYGYPPPPRYYRPRYYPPASVQYYPEPLSYRPFFFGVGLGFGGVGVFPVSGQGSSSSRVGMSYNLHFGFGVSPRWSIVLAGDGAFSYFTPWSVDQSVWSIGPQVFINRHLYARVGIGVATKSIDLNSSSSNYYGYDTVSDSGMGWTAALGWEFMQSYHVALGLELAATLGHYQTEDTVTYSKNDGTVGLNFMLNLF